MATSLWDEPHGQYMSHSASDGPLSSLEVPVPLKMNSNMRGEQSVDESKHARGARCNSDCPRLHRHYTNTGDV